MTNSATTSTNALIALLDDERAAFLAQAERIPRARWSHRPAADRWSVVEILDHVARIDFAVCRIAAHRATEPLTATSEQLAEAAMTAERVARVRSRVERFEAPERVRPNAILPSDEALDQLTSARTALKIAYLATSPAVLAGAIQIHPLLGPVTVVGWFELAAHHDHRHAQQLAELAEQLGPPCVASATGPQS